MSILGRHIPLRILVTVVLVLVVTGGVLVRAALPALGTTLWWPPAGGPARDIVLVVRNMAFYLEDDPATPNPTIRLQPGERVRIVLRNVDRGMIHDFAVPALQTAVDAVRWNEEGDVVLAAPSSPGTYQYVCRPHEAMMNGKLIVGES